MSQTPTTAKERTMITKVTTPRPLVSTHTTCGFTAHPRVGGAPAVLRCLGSNHRDYALLGTCDGCGREVVKTDAGRILSATNKRFACWSDAHECDPEIHALYQAAQAERADAGVILKGSTVTVVKGRKTPLGTTGEVFWLGTDSYGKPRVGFITATGEKHYTATSNVQPAHLTEGA